MRSPIQSQLAELNSRWLQLARRGDFESAWRASDEALALRRGIDCSHWPRHQQFLWNGEELRDKRVLVRCYHGLGDTLQFVRFIRRVRAIAAEVVLWVQPTLIPILRSLQEGPHRLLPLHDGVPDVEYDVDIELFEVMHALRVSLQEVEVPGPYLFSKQLSRPPRPREGARVGLVWRSGEWDNARSIPCAWLQSLASVSGIEWVLLQRGRGLAEWQHNFGVVPKLNDIMDEADEMRQLDLLITVDTCSAHLAGALGVPVWTLLPHVADWRWMCERSDSPWYPTMRLIRQRVPGDWRSVIAQVASDLENWK